MYNVGVYYLSTRGPSQSDEKAVEGFDKAAQQGNMDAAVNLGMCYMSGRGVTKDPAEGQRWLKTAAEQGHERAKTMLAQNFQGEGLGNNKPTGKVFEPEL